MNEDNPQHHSAGSCEQHPDQRRGPQPEVLAEPTYWPLVLSVGITFLAWGAVTSYPLLVLGLVMVAVAVINWIGDIRRAQRDETERQ
jgi:hypothetical protein